MIHLIFGSGGFTLDQLLHPLRYWGYEWWSGAGSDLGELTLIATVVGSSLATWLTVRRHFQCHADGCKKLGFHRVEGTCHRTCWPHHPVLSLQGHHSVPLELIHARHAQAQGETQ